MDLDRRAGSAAIEVDSAGFGSTRYPATDGAVAVMEDIGIDIVRRHSRQLDRELLEGADLTLGMNRQHVVDATVPALRA